jgi:uncharacterized membrane protein YbhN (UPF0104 family)
MPSTFRSLWGHRVARRARCVIPLLLLAALVKRLGADPFERSLHVLAPGPIAAALALGLVTTVAQALRWRTVALAYGSAGGLTRGRAVTECYRSGFLNSVLPGGVLGDAIRAWRQRPSCERGLRTSAQVVIRERVVGTTLLLLSVSIVTLPLNPWVSLIVLAAAAVAGLVAVPTLRRLTRRDQLAVVGWSLLSTAALVTKFFVAAATLHTVHGPRDTITLALIALAGMSVPLGVGGFGPREAVAAVAFSAVGLSADAGVTTAAAYGVLAAVSATPGALVMLLDLRRPKVADDEAEELALLPRIEPVLVLGLDGFERADDDRVLVGSLSPTGRSQIEFETDVLA